jgi:hypothetical protein
LARTGLSILIERLPKCILDIGFVVEGRNEEEMPEAMLGVSELSYLDLSCLRVGSEAVHGGASFIR